MPRDRTIEVPGEQESELQDENQSSNDREDDAVDYIIMLITQLTDDEQRILYSKIGLSGERKAVANIKSEEPPMPGIKKTLTDEGWLVE